MIKITDDYYLDADSRNYILRKRTVNQDETSKNFGEEKYSDEGYYVSIESAVKGLITLLTREYISKKTLNTIEELKNEIIKTREFIESLNLKL